MDLTKKFNPPQKRLIAYAAVLLVFVVAYAESLVSLFNIWAGVEITVYRYGFLVLACTFYLLYLKRAQFLEFASDPSGWALLPSLLLVLVWFVASLVDVRSLQLAILPCLLLAIFTAFFGNTFLRLASLPILLLLFAIPLWQPLVPFLKDATTIATEYFLRAIAKPVFVEGYFLHLPGGSFVVDDGCAGLRFLLVTLILSFLSVDLYAMNWRRGAILLGIGATLALVANWVRVIIVVLIGDYTKMEHPLVSDHADLGWFVYALIVLLPLFFLVGKLTHNMQSRPLQIEQKKRRIRESKNYLFIYFSAMAIVVSAPMVSTAMRYQEFEDRVVSLPQSSPSWISLSNRNLGWKANYQGASQYLFTQYESEEGLVELHLFNYANQQQGVELVNVENTMTDDQLWHEVPGTSGPITVDINSGRTIDVVATHIRVASGQQKVVWYWFEVGGLQTHDTYIAKLLQFIALFNRRNDASLIVVASDCKSSCAQSEKLLSRFIGAKYAEISDRL